MNIFKKHEKNDERIKIHKNIEDYIKVIIKLAMSRKLYDTHINKLDSLYTEYFEKYPDNIRQAYANQRIAQLRLFVKTDKSIEDFKKQG